MNVKLSSLDGGVIATKSDKKTARKCYESSLESKRGTYSITAQAGEPKEKLKARVSSERRPGPTGEVHEKEIRGKNFKLGDEFLWKMNHVVSSNNCP